MNTKKLGWLLTGCVFLLASLRPADAQTLTGQIAGTVVDAGGASVPAADVQLTNDLSKQVRTFQSGQDGSFVFPDLITGTYSIRVAKQGFKAYDSKGITLATGETLDLHELKLQVGDVTTSVSVEANVARVQTDSSDRFTTVESAAVDDIPNPTRSFLSATRSMPGAVATSAAGAGNVDGGGAFGGGPAGTANVVLQLDGIVQQDSGAPSSGVSTGNLLFNPDAVNEIQVQNNVMNAEFGDRAGGQVTVTTKNGTSQFHGSVYTFLRNEDFNANTFFFNRAGTPIAKSRYQNPGGTFGGPVLLPKLPFNRSRHKMYFFYAEDELYNKTSAVQSFTMPTALEDSGNFSQTVTTKGGLILINNPGNGQPFSGNIVPPSLINPEGAAMLNLFPRGCPWNGSVAPGAPGGAPNDVGVIAPCHIDPTGNRGYNTQSTFVTNNPQTTRTLRVDYNITSKTTMYVRLLQSLRKSVGVGSGQAGGGTAWGMFENTAPLNGRGDVISMIHTFTPTLITDFTVGGNFYHQQNQPANPTAFFNQTDLSTFKYPASVGAPLAGTLVNPFQVFGGNYLNLIPNISLAAGSATTGNAPQTPGQAYVSGTPSFGFDTRWPFDGTEFTTNYTNNWTKVQGKHTIKAGFNLEHSARNVSVFENYEINGSYYFGTDSGNPLDTGYPLSNLLLGNIQSYGQDNVKQVNHGRYYQYEWYLQDTWKISRRLTLDYGMRFQVIPQDYSSGATLGLFEGNLYNAGQTGTLLMPSCTVSLPASGTCPTVDLRAMNPKTGALYPGVDIAKFDPASYAGNDPYSGIQVFKNGKVFNVQHPQLGPRFGFAWDVLGNGKMALRGGFGIFYNRAYPVDIIAASGGLNGPMKIPPYYQSPTYFDTSFSGLSTAQAFLGPQAFDSGSLNMPDPTTYQWSFGIQRDLGKGLVIEAAYVGNILHHGESLSEYNANPIPPDTVWSPTGGTCYASGYCTGTLNPAFVNPTNTGQPLNINLVRALLPGDYNGMSDLSAFTSNGESNYNSLQEQLNKRFGKRIQFSSNWTWQKTQAYTPNQYLAQHLIKTVAGRKQAVNIQLNFTVPTITNLIGKNFATKAIFDGWHIDGVLSYYSGNPDGVSCSVTQNQPAGYPNGQDSISGAIPMRCEINGPVFLPAGSTPSVANGNAANTDPSLWYPIASSSFSLPPLKTNGFGNTPQVLYWGPGFENEDVSIYKAFTLKKESQQFILRADITNVRNHFNPGDPSGAFQYNFQSGANTNATFGQITSQAGAPRAMALSLRFRF